MRRIMMLICLLWLGVSTTIAQDPVTVEPERYKVEVNNNQVRVLRCRYQAHAKGVMHEHPPSVWIALTKGHERLTSPDGKVSEAQYKAGDLGWSPAQKHQVENIGDQPFEVILVELKNRAASKKPEK